MPTITPAEYTQRTNRNQPSERNSPMKTFVALCLALLILHAGAVGLNAFAQKRVCGYTRRDGTRVESHRRTAPNKTERDNWSSKPNANPDTGKRGTKTPRR
jgi:hypothetical protein